MISGPMPSPGIKVAGILGDSEAGLTALLSDRKIGAGREFTTETQRNREQIQIRFWG